MKPYVCVHGHFYQPPRENPWLESIEQQDAARPYHDWNERITAECYAPNTASRILDGEGRIRDIVNNYARISFNFGPTLLSWLETEAPRTYGAILEADRESQRRFDGHGAALAQAYNHMILPLANSRDKRCQVVWGLADFERRFGRRPEGLWLPETAVDLESLELLAEMGLGFTILSPRQALRVRPLAGRAWHDVSDGTIDTRLAYEQRLPSGRSIALFFFHAAVSQAVAFERLLDDGERFAQRLVETAGEESELPRLGHIATDGETYGHHHRFGEMALTYALERIESQGLATLTNHAAFLAAHPPRQEVEIREHSSWSCVHGVERWHADCGCRVESRPSWTQAWRAPLRRALDWLRDSLAEPYERQARRFFPDPWQAREGYADVVLDRSPESRARFLARHAARELPPSERVAAFELLELQRYAMLMYTSCGWFFDDVSGVETVQILQYAARAIELARNVAGIDLEPEFLERLRPAESNLPEQGDGRALFERLVRPAAASLGRLAAHHATRSLFPSPAPAIRLRTLQLDEEEHEQRDTPGARLTLGRLRVSFRPTEERAALMFAGLYLGSDRLEVGVGALPPEAHYAEMRRAIVHAFESADLPAARQLVHHHFPGGLHTLETLLRDEQRRILDTVLAPTLDEAARALLRLYEQHAPLMRHLAALGVPLPRVFRAAAEYVLNARVGIEAQTLESSGIERVDSLLLEAKAIGVTLDAESIGLALRRAIERAMELWRANPMDPERLSQLVAAVGLVRRLPFEVVLWEAENAFHELLARTPGSFPRELKALGEALRFRLD